MSWPIMPAARPEEKKCPQYLLLQKSGPGSGG